MYLVACHSVTIIHSIHHSDILLIIRILVHGSLIRRHSVHVIHIDGHRLIHPRHRGILTIRWRTVLTLHRIWPKWLENINVNPSAVDARDLRLLQAATKMLQLDRMRFDG